MEIREVVELLMNLINDTEHEIFHDKDERIAFFGGREYTRNDFNNMRRVVDRIHRFYKTNSKTSYTYILNHTDYNKLLALQNYYKRKKNKKEKDYYKMQTIAEKLNKVKEQMKKDKEDKDKQKLLKEERERIEEQRKKELLDKYGFIVDSD